MVEVDDTEDADAADDETARAEAAAATATAIAAVAREAVDTSVIIAPISSGFSKRIEPPVFGR